jgi:hypothetical protein
MTGDEPSQGIVIAQFADESHAHMAATRLESDDIAATVLSARRRHGVGSWRAALAVAESDVARAVAVLKSTPAAPFLLRDTELR